MILYYGEGWKKYLKALLEISEKKNNHLFTPNELAIYLKVSINAVNKYLQKLVKKGLIILYKESENIRKGKLINGATPRVYKLTNLELRKDNLLDQDFRLYIKDKI